MNLSADPDNIFLLEQLAETSDNAFFLYEVKRKQLKYISPAFETIWERSRQELVNNFESLFGTVFPQDRLFVLRCWNWYLNPQRGTHKTFEFRIFFPDGRLKWLYAEIFLLRNEDNSFCISGWVRDVSERKTYLEVLRKYAAKKNATLEVLSHDIAGFLALIQNLSSGAPANFQHPEMLDMANKLDLIRQTCQRGTDLITNLVNHEFLESSTVKLNRQRLDLVSKVGNIVSMFQEGQRELGKTFIIEANAPEIYAEVDDVKFMQVINNLISNAIKFTPEGGLIRIWLEDRPQSVQIQVADNGIGIPEAWQPKLFDRYTEARRPGLRGEPSVGLGMNIIRSIVEMHGGSIWFNSRENEGSTFYIDLPKD
jgi:two-component system sensor histidine kinase VicK